MFLEILLCALFGIGIGVVAGLIPGLHPNTIFVLILSLLAVLPQWPVEAIIAFVISVSITNIFFDFIPSIFFGAPGEGTELAVLPGHRMLLEGRGYEAVSIAVIGGLATILLTVATLPLLLVVIPLIYNSISSYIHYMLTFLLIWLLSCEVGIKKACSIFVFILSGIFGLLSLNSFGSNMTLFPALTGMFGLSGLFASLFTMSMIPEQQKTHEIAINIKGAIAGWVSGLVVGILPGVGSSQANIVSARLFNTKPRDFLASLGGISASNMIFTFIVLFTLEKTRSGASWAVSQLAPAFTQNLFLLILATVLFSAFISAIFTLRVAKLISSNIREVDYRKLR